MAVGLFEVFCPVSWLFCLSPPCVSARGGVPESGMARSASVLDCRFRDFECPGPNYGPQQIKDEGLTSLSCLSKPELSTAIAALSAKMLRPSERHCRERDRESES